MVKTGSGISALTRSRLVSMLSISARTRGWGGKYLLMEISARDSLAASISISGRTFSSCSWPQRDPNYSSEIPG